MKTDMNKSFLVLGLLLISLGLVLITSSIARAQTNNEFAVPLTDPSGRGKLKAHINYGSITVKGTGRKDVLVRYTSAEEKENDDEDSAPSRSGLGCRVSAARHRAGRRCDRA